MDIRTFRPGDEAAQVAIYNAVGAALPKFKPATTQDVQRRTRARGFDPETRFYAEVANQVVAYCVSLPNGRVSYPWALPSYEAAQEPLMDAALEGLRRRGVARAFAAYRSDWPTMNEFFRDHGFAQVREMVNYLLDFADMPTPSVRPGGGTTPVTPEDVPALFALAPQVLRVQTHEALHRHLFKNPYFTSDALFAVRGREGALLAAGILITEPTYADPRAVDAQMPCFRLGAFGTEGMEAKRLRGLFSFLARPDRNLPALGMDLLVQAAHRLVDRDDVPCFAAQAPSDVPELRTFYDHSFRRQGSFPVFERAL